MLVEITEDFHIDFTEVVVLSFVNDGVVIHFKNTAPMHLICLEKANALKEFLIDQKLKSQKITEKIENYWKSIRPGQR